MKQIEASKLARGLGAALERVVAGESLEVIRYGRVVALLVPPSRDVRPDTAAPVMSGVVKQTPVDAVSPQARPTGNVGKVSPAADRQRTVDQILRDSRRGN